MVEAVPAGRGSRFWLFTPFVLLLILALAWTAAWFYVRGRAVEALDGFMAREAAVGRQWSCPGRRVGGYPFRIEVSCPQLGLKRADVTASLGPSQVVAQVYQPRHVIAEIGGPLRVTDGERVGEARWRDLRLSLRLAGAGLQRVSVLAAEPSLRMEGLPVGPVEGRAARLEAHLRPSPARNDGAYDLSLRVEGAAAPALAPVVGSDAPLDLDLQGTVTQARDAAPRPLIEELERWRRAGGQVEIERLVLAQGPRRVEAKGTLALDDLRRPAGRLEASATGLEGLVAGLLSGRGPEAAEPRPGPSRTTRLPAVRIENGRVAIGPLQVPGLRLAPLY
jgi:hypothetical protein